MSNYALNKISCFFIFLLLHWSFNTLKMCHQKFCQKSLAKYEYCISMLNKCRIWSKNIYGKKNEYSNDLVVVLCIIFDVSSAFSSPITPPLTCQLKLQNMGQSQSCLLIIYADVLFVDLVLVITEILSTRHSTTILMVWFMVFSTTFNNNSVISWWSVLLVEKTTDLSKVTDKLEHVMVYRVHLRHHEQGSNSQH
jgi:hypothetical protein